MHSSLLLPFTLLLALSTASPLNTTPLTTSTSTSTSLPPPPLRPSTATTDPTTPFPTSDGEGVKIIPINPQTITTAPSPQITYTSIHDGDALFTVLQPVTVTNEIRPRAPAPSGERTLKRASVMLPSIVKVIASVTRSQGVERPRETKSVGAVSIVG